MDEGRKPRRILIADTSYVVIDNIKNALDRDPSYEIRIAENGKDCLDLIYSFDPQLIIVELTLPILHGIEVLKRVKSNPQASSTGVIISTWKALIQDYQAAIENGADYYLIKPFSQSTILRLVNSFFEGELKPASFPISPNIILNENEFYLAPFPEQTSYLKIWGTRGSIPVAGHRCRNWHQAPWSRDFKVAF
jgi:DNA-binding response OmpR family regulator